MGCDIHFYVEKKNKETGAWESPETWVKKYEDCGPMVDKSYYDGRDYNLFAMLANVRNGYSFAGCDTGDGFVPITGKDPRGLPDDVSPEVAAQAEEWDCDGHSHQYLTVHDILNYNWAQTTKLRGYVDPATFAQWIDSYDYKYEKYSAPKSYCGMVSGGGVVHVTQAEMMAAFEKSKEKITKSGQKFDGQDKWIEAMANDMTAQFDGAKSIYAQCEWERPYYMAAGSFISETLPLLLALCEGDFDSVRAVFWFDN